MTETLNEIIKIMQGTDLVISRVIDGQIEFKVERREE